MPTYEYRCNNCGHEFELFQSMSDPVKKKCPSCARLALERLIGTGAALIFKGSGFYETDYRSKSYTSAQEADTKAAKESSEPKSEKPDSGKSDSGKSDAAKPDSSKPDSSKPGADKPGAGKGERKTETRKSETGGTSSAPKHKPDPKARPRKD